MYVVPKLTIKLKLLVTEFSHLNIFAELTTLSCF